MSNILEGINKIISSISKSIANTELILKDKWAQTSLIILLLIKELLLVKFYINNDPLPQIYIFVILLSVFFLSIVPNPILSIFNISSNMSFLIKLFILIGLIIYGLIFALKTKKDNDNKDSNQNKYELNVYIFIPIILTIGHYLIFNIYKNLSTMTAVKHSEKQINWAMFILNIILFLVFFMNNLPKNPNISDNKYVKQNKTYIYIISSIFILSMLISFGVNALTNNTEYRISYLVLFGVCITLLVFSGFSTFNYFNIIKNNYDQIYENNKYQNIGSKKRLYLSKNNNSLTSSLLLFLYIMLAITIYNSYGIISNLKPLIVLGLIGLVLVHFLFLLSGSYEQDLKNNVNKVNIYTNEKVTKNKVISTNIASIVLSVLFVILIFQQNISKSKIRTIIGILIIGGSFFLARSTGKFISKVNNLVETDNKFTNNISEINSLIKKYSENASKFVDKDNVEFQKLKNNLTNIFKEFNIKKPQNYTFNNDKITIIINDNNTETQFDYNFKNKYATFTGLINDINNQMLTKYKEGNYIIDTNLCFNDDTIVGQNANFKRYFTILVKYICKKKDNKNYELLNPKDLNIQIKCTKNVNNLFSFMPPFNEENSIIGITENKYVNKTNYTPILGNYELIEKQEVLNNLVYITSSNKYNTNKLNTYFSNELNLIDRKNKINTNEVKICCQYAEKQILNYDILCDFIVDIETQELPWNEDENSVNFYTKYDEITSKTEKIGNTTTIVEYENLRKTVNNQINYFKNHTDNFLKTYNNYIFKNIINLSDNLSDNLQESNLRNIGKTQIVSRILENSTQNNNVNLRFLNSSPSSIKTYISNPSIFMNNDYYINKSNYIKNYLGIEKIDTFAPNGKIDINEKNIDEFSTVKNNTYGIKSFIEKLKDRLKTYKNLEYKTGSKDTKIYNNNMINKTNNILEFIIDLNKKGYTKIENKDLTTMIENIGNFYLTYISFLLL